MSSLSFGLSKLKTMIAGLMYLVRVKSETSLRWRSGEQIDAGVNIVYSPFYLLSYFPACHSRSRSQIVPLGNGGYANQGAFGVLELVKMRGAKNVKDVHRDTIVLGTTISTRVLFAPLANISRVAAGHLRGAAILARLDHILITVGRHATIVLQGNIRNRVGAAAVCALLASIRELEWDLALIA
jgi:hypothetical protein